jgi:hypothetical protein
MLRNTVVPKLMPSASRWQWPPASVDDPSAKRGDERVKK